MRTSLFTLLALSTILILSCDIFNKTEVEEKRFFRLDVSQIDTAGIDEIIISGVNEKSADTVLIYKWEKGEQLQTKLFVPDKLQGDFSIIFIAKKDDMVEIAQSMAVDTDEPEKVKFGSDIPGLRDYIFFTIISPGNQDTVGIKNLTISGSLKSEHTLDAFLMNGTPVSSSGNSWTRNVELVDGKNIFVFILLDNIGNKHYDTLVVFYSPTAVDNIKPVFSNLSPADSTTVSVSPVLLSGEVIDASGIALLIVNGDTVEVNSNSWSDSIELNKGKNEIDLMAVDNDTAANTATKTLVIFYDPTAKDETNPLLSIDSPNDSAEIPIDSVLVKGTATDANNIGSVTVNGSKAVLDGTNWSLQVGLEEGLNKILVIATDNSTNKNETRDSITVIYDKTIKDNAAPTLNITKPSNNTVVDKPDSVEISGTIYDLSGIKSVLVNDDTAKVKEGNWSLFISLVDTGKNKIKAIATDNEGNQSFDSINVIYRKPAIDTIAPEVTITTPSKDSVVFGTDSITIKGVVTDSVSGVQVVLVNGDTADINSDKWELKIRILSDTNIIKAIAYDSTDNKDSCLITIIYQGPKTKPVFITEISEMDSLAIVGSKYTDTAQASDVDGDSLSYSLITSPAGMTHEKQIINWTPVDSQIGRNNIAMEVKDVDGSADTLKWTITVTDSNHAPVFDSEERDMDSNAVVGKTYKDTLRYSDIDGDSLSLSLKTFPEGITLNDSIVHWTPVDTQIGEQTVTILVEDSHGKSNVFTWKVTVVDSNHAPKFISTSDNMTAAGYVGSIYSDTISVSDSNGDSVIITFINQPNAMIFENNIINWTPADSQTGDYQVKLQASDGKGKYDTLSWTINVSDTNVFIDARDGQAYRKVTIGAITWMAENLNYEVTHGNSWCYNDSSSNCDIYGRFYDYSTVIADNHSNGYDVCPAGWHLPTDDNWQSLEKTLGMSDSDAGKEGYRGVDEGKKLKSISGWACGEQGLNEYGFKVQPAGLTNSGSFGSLGYSAYFWSSDRFLRLFSCDQNNIHREYQSGVDPTKGYNIRCIKGSLGPNHAPVFTSEISDMDSLVKTGMEYKDTVHGTDEDGDNITFLKLDGPSINLSDSIITWTPDISDTGAHNIQIIASDEEGGLDTLTWNIYVELANKVIAYYPFNGNANDEIGSNDGNPVGAALTIDRFGREDSAYIFDGVDDYINLGTIGNSNLDEFSISFWVYNDGAGAGDNPRLWYKGSDSRQMCWGNANEIIGFEIGNINQTTVRSSTLKERTWFHIVGTFSNTGDRKARIYINGSLDSVSDSSVFNEIQDLSTSDLILGARGAGNQSEVFKGKIDDIHIFNYVIDSSKVDSLYHINNWQGSEFTDERDGKVYKMVTIGTQIWMGENLAYLPQVHPVAEGSEDAGNEGKSYFYVYNYTPTGDEVANAKATSNFQTYGVLYNWYAVMNGQASSSANPSGVKGLCPTGWHVPSDDEFKTLEVYIGMLQSQADATSWRGTVEGKELKSTAWDGTDDYGFSALPGGNRYGNGSWGSIGEKVHFWTSTEQESGRGYRRHMVSTNDQITRDDYPNNYAHSLRCVKD
ncbi:MAG: hypothetical protein HQK83_11725 [Fibrobacteria bacterium]|nr:hypothetical protein [Fibrobacteria bacterium]